MSNNKLAWSAGKMRCSEQQQGLGSHCRCTAALCCTAGNLSVICQAQHKRSGRHVALKIYKRSRLHEMERFQVSRGQGGKGQMLWGF
jgi:hypothetical protein